MREEFIKEEKIKDKTEEEKRIELIKSVIKTKEELANYNNNFEYINDDLIDFYTLQIKASKMKLDYLMKTAKGKGIRLDTLEELLIKKNDAI